LSRVSKCENREAPASWRRKCRGASEALRPARHGSALDRLSRRWESPITQTPTQVSSSRYCGLPPPFWWDCGGMGETERNWWEGGARKE